MSDLWRELLGRLSEDGVHARVVPVERLEEAVARAAAGLAEADLPAPVAAAVRDDVAFTLPRGVRPWRSAVVFAVARPLTRATLVRRGVERTVPVPPHYAGYAAVPRALAARVDALLRPARFAAAHCEPPLKTLAAAAGLARYGRNNVAYVEGLGSWLQLGACVADAPPPAGAAWGPPRLLERCEHCTACLRACPTRAIGGERFLLHTERCLTYHNESPEPLPRWLDPRVHHTAVGCLRCQAVCPENRRVTLIETEPERFDEAETAAILAAEGREDDRRGLGEATREKLDRCGLDYSPAVVARNLRVLLDA